MHLDVYFPSIANSLLSNSLDLKHWQLEPTSKLGVKTQWEPV